jgi:hypothetical protein
MTMPIKRLFKLLYITILLLVSVSVVQAASSKDVPFGLSSLQGTYAYYNKGDDVVSLGVWTFDGKGTAILKLRFSWPDKKNGRFVVSVLGTGRYEVNEIWQGVVMLMFKIEDKKLMNTLHKEVKFHFVITKTSDAMGTTYPKLATEVESFMSEAGFNNQAITPTWVRTSDYVGK